MWQTRCRRCVFLSHLGFPCAGTSWSTATTRAAPGTRTRSGSVSSTPVPSPTTTSCLARRRWMKPTEVRGVDGYWGRGLPVFIFLSSFWYLFIGSVSYQQILANLLKYIWLKGDTSASLAVVCVYIFSFFFLPYRWFIDINCINLVPKEKDSAEVPSFVDGTANWQGNNFF